ncbi:FAD-dependent monooxygenase [Rhodococcus qingshengii]|uniref:FAD-dependent monooxygenase n=1 Tax=Rhodococcus qingshengii TaxID=334542 RepID=UPI0036DEEDE1
MLLIPNYVQLGGQSPSGKHENTHRIRGRYVVAADGGRSTVRRSLASPSTAAATRYRTY